MLEQINRGATQAQIKAAEARMIQATAQYRGTILEAFAAGVNAYMEEMEDNLPVEFEMTGIRPEPWLPETPLLRMQTAMPLADARREIRQSDGHSNLLAVLTPNLGAALCGQQAQALDLATCSLTNLDAIP